MGEPHRRDRDQKGEHRRVELLPAPVQLEGRVGALPAQQKPGAQIVAHIGKGRPGRGAEPD